MAKKKTKRSQTPVSKPRSEKKKPFTRQKKRSSTPKGDNTRQRLQRVMAAAGVGSRRECELIIEEGRVEIDGEVVTKLGVKVDPHKQEIYVDAQKLSIEKLQYFILNKPPGVISTSKDPSGRPRVIDLIKTDKRVYNVGRLDRSSEGLILVTNDGELAHRLTHPRYGIEKKYHVQVVGIPPTAELRKLEQGVYIAEGLARATQAKYLKKAKNGCWLEIILAEGRNREIRRMLASIGHKVRTLKRVAIGPLKLKDLPQGAHRRLTSAEIKSLQRATSGGAKAKPKRKRPVKRNIVDQKSPTGSTKKANRKTSPSKSTQRKSGKPAARASKTRTRRNSSTNARRKSKNANR